MIIILYVNQLNTRMFQIYVNKVYFYYQKIIDILVILWDEPGIFCLLNLLTRLYKNKHCFFGTKI